MELSPLVGDNDHQPPCGQSAPDIRLLQESLSRAWCEETAQAQWNPDRLSKGQCCVSSMVVQHYFGGIIVRGVTNKGGVHYWNELPGGAWYDSTRAQFDDDEHVVEHDRWPPPELYLFRETVEKYELLLRRVQADLGQREMPDPVRRAPPSSA